MKDDIKELDQKDSTALTRVLYDVMEMQEKKESRYFKIILVLIATILAMVISFFVYESQFVYKVEEETKSSSEMSYDISGDSATLNNIECVDVQGNQYTGNSVHNESRGDG